MKRDPLRAIPKNTGPRKQLSSERIINSLRSFIMITKSKGMTSSPRRRRNHGSRLQLITFLRWKRQRQRQIQRQKGDSLVIHRCSQALSSPSIYAYIQHDIPLYLVLYKDNDSIPPPPWRRCYALTIIVRRMAVWVRLLKLLKG